ncbi:MAG: histidine kinase [Firmicutes bacterium]|nr:histidine kinase [Bacillota bacterium]MCL5039552.1 histidine kinase [Bacillota bacterium]
MKLSRRIILTTSAIIVVMGLLTIFALQALVKSALKSYLVSRGVSLTETIAENIINPYLDGNLLVIDRALAAVKNRTADLEYAFLFDPDQRILLSTFEDGFPPDLLQKTIVPAGETTQVLLLRTETSQVRDIGLYLIPGLPAQLHLGFSEETIQHSLGQVGMVIAFLTLVGVTVGSVASLTISSFITRPLEVLSSMATRIGQGDLNQEILVKSKDEVGQLAESFNQMTRRLRETIKRLQDSEAELKRREELMGQLLAKAMRAQEDERKRIARELHDETSQSLAALVLGLKVAATVVKSDPERAEKTLEQMKNSAVNIVKELHNVVYDLRPTLLDDRGLIPALTWYAESRLKPQGVILHIEAAGDPTQLSPEAETILYRIGQEAISNVYRHARAKNLWLSLKVKSEEAVLSIRDDGRGFNPKTVFSSEKSPLGLLGIQERASLLQGQVSFWSQPGHGTLVSTTLPLAPSIKPAPPKA